MKLFLLLSIAGVIGIGDGCGKNKKDTTYKARFEIKAICMNYTFRLIEGDMDTTLISSKWTDESTNKSYTNVFGISNPCDLPKTLNEGDEFYFKIDTSEQKECIVCMAYYPTPPRKLAIRVVDK